MMPQGTSVFGVKNLGGGAAGLHFLMVIVGIDLVIQLCRHRLPLYTTTTTIP
jgi:hypothetical protein